MPMQASLDLLTLSQATATPAGELAFGEVLLRISMAGALCFLVGWERKIADKPAGRRTMALIGAGAAAFTVMGVQIASQMEYRDGLQLDPTRIARRSKRKTHPVQFFTGPPKQSLTQLKNLRI